MWLASTRCLTQGLVPHQVQVFGASEKPVKLHDDSWSPNLRLLELKSQGVFMYCSIVELACRLRCGVVVRF
jgi:hypothetical protein